MEVPLSLKAQPKKTLNKKVIFFKLMAIPTEEKNTLEWNVSIALQNLDPSKLSMASITADLFN